MALHSPKLVYVILQFSFLSVLKKGVATFFLPDYQNWTEGTGSVFGQVLFSLVKTRYEWRTDKNTTCILQNKKTEVFRNVP